MPRERVLVAESDPLQRQLIDMLLAPDAMQLTMVESGRQALEHLRESTPDLALLALDLPDIAGNEICAKIKKVSRLKYVPVILVAEQTQGLGLSDSDRARGENAGADVVVPRPLGDKNLRERIRRLVQVGAEERERRQARLGHEPDGATTHIIDDALGVLDGQNEGATGTPETERPPAPPGASNPSRPGGTAEVDESAAPSAAPVPRRGVEPASNVGNEARAMREELSALKMENRQLQRKLQAKQEELATQSAPKVRELKRQVEELERRNRALLETINDLKRRGGRGLFGRGGT